MLLKFVNNLKFIFEVLNQSFTQNASLTPTHSLPPMLYTAKSMCPLTITPICGFPKLFRQSLTLLVV